MRIVSLLLFTVLLTYCRSTLTYTHPDVDKWDKVTLDFPGPETSEDAADNPFVNYRLDVTFREGDFQVTVPGFYAVATGSADSGADSGNLWQVRYRPEREGEWTYTATLVRGDSIYMNPDPEAGKVVERYEGAFLVGPAAAGERGKLIRDHPRYLRWAESGDYFIKTGVDSPENLLGYQDFDATYRHSNEFREGESSTEGLHTFSAHEGDARRGDPTWKDGLGKGILGGINYLHEAGVNSIYFLTLNINGDGKDVWPYTNHEERYRFDVSKLAQWERVFDHADSLGMMLHFVLNETENETLLDGGDTGPQRQLYFRELVARFGHHRAVTWNLGEENGPNDWSDSWQSTDQQRQVIDWFAVHDPYGNYVVLHTHPGEEAFSKIYEPLLGTERLGGLSLQLGDPYSANAVTQRWIQRSAEAGAPWIMTLDEVGPWHRGIDPDAAAPSNNQDSLRALTLWGNLMAGGAGVEWYFGARSPHNDLNLEDWRSRDRAYRWSAHARRFFEDHLPFWEMEPRNELTRSDTDWCFAKTGEVYLVYLPFGRPATLDLSETTGEYAVSWFNPREGGGLLDTGEWVDAADGLVELVPPGEGDWAALLRLRAGE
ncbi:collagenase-like protein with putative collagen-binding domain [Neolewinella xylanilytica]|uniref:Collagenase-like protein with putative collagen-binding domain n=1 Tax=Neolewinella xylanilytica TaxID=1514080 RepID=A0A2S6IB12_9BACT|nr:DUF5060 domain-containing protein [Neolewinella xylanilytica]PPK88656.1 collagenase-like protein with putative collagen-binding domain [Neolewinella xylanilytica]